MSHYVLHVPVNAEDVKVMRTEFDKYMEQVGVITIRVSSPIGDDDPPDELQHAMRRIFLNVLVALSNDLFEGLH